MSYDPYSAKLAANPISAQPAQAQYYTPVGTVAAAPVPAGGNYVIPAAQSVHSAQPGMMVANQQQNVVYSLRAPPGRWRDSICDFCNNLFPSCYCACCCFYGMWLVGQMAQKTGFSKFTTIVWATAGMWLLGLILTFATGAGAFLVLVPLLFSFVVSIMLRMHVVRTENITECGPFGEFCAGFWCWYCSIAQMARHLYGYKHVLDGDGNPDRPDNYPPQQDGQV